MAASSAAQQLFNCLSFDSRLCVHCGVLSVTSKIIEYIIAQDTSDPRCFRLCLLFFFISPLRVAKFRIHNLCYLSTNICAHIFVAIYLSNLFTFVLTTTLYRNILYLDVYGFLMIDQSIDNRSENKRSFLLEQFG